jgi:hypothetical protein
MPNLRFQDKKKIPRSCAMHYFKMYSFTVENYHSSFPDYYENLWQSVLHKHLFSIERMRNTLTHSKTSTFQIINKLSIFLQQVGCPLLERKKLGSVLVILRGSRKSLETVSIYYTLQ